MFPREQVHPEYSRYTTRGPFGYSGNSMPVIEEQRGPIDYDACGEGPTVVLVPGSCSTGAAWRLMMSHWVGRFRCVTTSLLGYGATAERRIGVPTTIAHEAEIVESVVRRAARPVHLVGHSFGGLVALSVALRNRLPLLSLAILEAPVPELLRHVQEHRHYRDFRAMTDGYFREFHAGNREAIGSMIDFYGGPGAFAAMPPRVRSYAVETTAVNILDWADAYSFRVTPALLGEIELPTLVLWGGASHPAVGRANELLARHIADASAVTVAGAAHFMIATHAQETARAVAQHIARARQQLRSTALRRAG